MKAVGERGTAMNTAFIAAEAPINIVHESQA